MLTKSDLDRETEAVGDIEASRAAHIRQATKVNNFQDRQRRRPRWVSFIDLLALFARSSKTLEESECLKAVAYEKLCDSIRRGEFDRAGRSMVLYLSERPGLPPRMTRDRLQSAGEICHGPRAWEMFCKGWLDPCWIPVGMAVLWCRAHDVEPLSAWHSPPSHKGGPEVRRYPRRHKRAYQQEKAQRIIQELFPEGLPSRVKLPNFHLCKRVNKKLGNDAVSRDTILRAAGRKQIG